MTIELTCENFISPKKSCDLPRESPQLDDLQEDDTTSILDMPGGLEASEFAGDSKKLEYDHDDGISDENDEDNGNASSVGGGGADGKIKSVHDSVVSIDPKCIEQTTEADERGGGGGEEGGGKANGKHAKYVPPKHVSDEHAADPTVMCVGVDNNVGSSSRSGAKISN